MIKNNRIYGTPIILYKDAQATIEALTGLEEGSIAYATDVNKIGVFSGILWIWYDYIPATTALNDVVVGNGSGSWIKKTLAEFVTIIRTALDLVYAAIVHAHAGTDITSGTIDFARLPTPKVDTNDEATLRQRMDGGITFNHHFDVSALPAGLTWAGAPFVTPSSISYADPSIMNIYNTGTWRAFLYDSALPTSNSWLASLINYVGGTTNFGFVGVRYDDNSDNNYVELGMYCYGWTYYVPKIYHRTGGGAVTEVTDANNIYLPYMFVANTAQFGTKWSNWGVNLNVGLPNQGSVLSPMFKINVTGRAWTPTRFGIVFRGNTDFRTLLEAYSRN